MLALVELIAVVSSGLFGVLLARQKRMDLVGVFSVACCTAFGGGTLRDLFLDRHPLFWIENAHYAVIVFGMALVSGILRKVRRATLEKVLHLPDALLTGGAGRELDALGRVPALPGNRVQAAREVQVPGGVGQIVFQASADWSPMPLSPAAGPDQGLLA